MIDLITLLHSDNGKEISKVRFADEERNLQCFCYVGAFSNGRVLVGQPGRSNVVAERTNARRLV